jgi:hypothetical protein
MSDDYRPREHDHLVEPFFAGLRSAEKPAGASASGSPGFFARLFARLRAWLRRARGNG